MYHWWWGEVDVGESSVCMGIYVISISSFQFCYETKISQKMSFKNMYDEIMNDGCKPQAVT